MSTNMEDKCRKLREERVAREQARIQKLRELNMKKYPKNEPSNLPTPTIVKKTASTSQIKTAPIKQLPIKTVHSSNVKSNIQVSSNAKPSTVHPTNKRPFTVPVTKKPDYANIKPKVVTKFATKSDTKVDTKLANIPSKNNMIKNKDVNVAGDVKKCVVRTKIPNKHLETNVENKSKPDIIITQPSDAESIASTVKSDTNITASIDKNTLPNDVLSKPDILISTPNETKKSDEKKVLTEITKKVSINSKLFAKNDVKTRKSFAPSSGLEKPKINARKSMLPKLVEGTKSESVFDRLYKPKLVKKTSEQSDAEKLRTDPSYLKKVVKNADLIFNMHQQKKEEVKLPRRSISAVHFRRISKNEIHKCIHKWGSIGEKLNKVDLHDEIPIKDDKLTSAVKSERKKVQFLTPSLSFNTPRPDELQARLKSWLQKRGKSLSSYHHLQCFGLQHSKLDFGTPKSVSSIPFEDAVESPTFDDENKENIALDSDSDDGSYSEMMNEPKEALSNGNKIDTMNWRNVSMASESVYNDSNTSHKFHDITLTPAGSVTNVDDLLHGTLNDLTTLLKEGFDWQQGARWLRSIRSRFPDAPRTPAYWECRAALEEARGNLTGSLECWNEAVATGTEPSVVDSNVDQLLCKFMQLKISPRSGASDQVNSKLVDVKNVFKSTIIKFSVQQAKLRKQSNPPTPVFTVTPVRRSARLSHRVSRTPLRLCDTVRQAATIAPEHVFTPNDNFVHTP